MTGRDAAAGFSIRAASRAELDLMIDWAAAEGWNPGLADAGPFWAADSSGFLVGLIDDVPVSAISVVRYPGGFGFLGFYIVRPEARGRGHGWATWQAGMARLQGHNVGLDGVVAQQPKYQKSGFVLAHRNVRYGGVPVIEPGIDQRLVLVGPAVLAEVLDYDRTCFPDTREQFLRQWVARPRVGWAYMENGRCRGYGVVRACRRGFKVGPLFADRPDVAEALLSALVAEAAGAEIFLDVPEPNPEAVRLAERCGLAPVFETARMYTKGNPNLPLERIFGITTFELG